MEKLSNLEQVSPEFNVTRNYLDWLTCLPWGQHSPEIFDLPHARKVRDTDAAPCAQGERYCCCLMLLHARKVRDTDATSVRGTDAAPCTHGDRY
jgi:hypothetical protein